MTRARVREFRDQAESYRQTASGNVPPDIADRYLDWAWDLDRRAQEMEDAAVAGEAK
jgi:hypothetical protein